MGYPPVMVARAMGIARARRGRPPRDTNGGVPRARPADHSGGGILTPQRRDGVILAWRRDPRKRVLEKELAALKRTYEPDLDALRREGKARTESYQELVDEYRAMCRPFNEELWAIDSHDLRRCALKWAVVVPPFHEWEHGAYGHYHLDEETRATIKSSIRDQQRESTKWWADVLARMATFVVGILGALTGLVTACQNN